MMINNSFAYIKDSVTSIYDNYLPNLNKYDYAILAIHGTKFFIAVSNFANLLRTGHFMNSPYKYTLFTGISISDDIFSVYRQVTKISYGVYDDVINAVSLSVTTASSLTLAHTAANQFEQSLVDIRSNKLGYQQTIDSVSEKISSIQRAEDVFSKQSAKVNNVLDTANVLSVVAPIEGKGSEYSAPSTELISAHQSKLTEAQSKIQECTERENKLTKSQVHIGTQDYIFFFMNNAKSLTQIQEIIENEGFDFEQLRPKIITIAVNAFMYFGYSKWLHPKLPGSIVGDDKASATLKVVVQAGASIAVTSILAFGDKLYNVTHDMLFERSDSIDEKEKKVLDHEESNNDEVAKEIAPEDTKVNHEEL
ncbi:MAG: hypothetical protein AB8B46_05345 [Candidatus Midichloriaceae bacterium]